MSARTDEITREITRKFAGLSGEEMRELRTNLDSAITKQVIFPHASGLVLLKGGGTEGHPHPGFTLSLDFSDAHSSKGPIAPTAKTLAKEMEAQGEDFKVAMKTLLRSYGAPEFNDMSFDEWFPYGVRFRFPMSEKDVDDSREKFRTITDAINNDIDTARAAKRAAAAR